MESKGIKGFNNGLIKSVGETSSYNPTEWATGDVITADKLNHMEDGIEAASSDSSMALHYDTEEAHFDKTYNEVKQAIIKGVIPVYNTGSDSYLLVGYDDNDLVIRGKTIIDGIRVFLKASTGDDYLNFYEYPPG